ncbi:MAG: hypothetical protein FJ295_09115 [Planctomycetes bacterium]|nr:hypothetical protein [Planctomycetota bacterium]
MDDESTEFDRPECGLRDPWDGSPSVAFHLLDCAPFSLVARLQELIGERLLRNGLDQTVILVCEHPPIVTVGRRGSWRQLLTPGQESAVDRRFVKWVPRSGGCIVHGPGQLAVYSIAPHHPASPAARIFCAALHRGLASFLGEIGISIRRADPQLGIWSRLGAVAVYGNRDSEELTYHGLYLNVYPPRGSLNQVQFLPPSDVPMGQTARMSSLLAEQRQPVRMAQVRAELMPAIAQALGCERYHIFTGHPLLSRVRVHDG